jgi:hypothetical protein
MVKFRKMFCGFSRQLVTLKCIIPVICVLFVAASAADSSAGVAEYCNTLETAWHDVISDLPYPGCERATGSKEVKALYKLQGFSGEDFPSDVFLKFEVILGGIWASTLLWIIVLCTVITQAMASVSNIHYTRMESLPI